MTNLINKLAASQAKLTTQHAFGITYADRTPTHYQTINIMTQFVILHVLLIDELIHLALLALENINGIYNPLSPMSFLATLKYLL